ncbi:MAG: hypothetical protein WCR20_00910 [Verrucomicrobiota bacterium]|jgi:hypothetical protein|nr:hypothetical protein [Verrucomicrobiota bacterium]
MPCLINKMDKAIAANPMFGRLHKEGRSGVRPIKNGKRKSQYD